jgi:hypothetical protein
VPSGFSQSWAVNAGTRTARFIELLHLPGEREHDEEGSGPEVFVPRSGITLADGQAHCQASCN